MASGKQLFCRSQHTPCEVGHGLLGVQGPVTCVQPAGQAPVAGNAEQRPVSGSQQTSGMQGLGVQTVVLVRICPLQAVPSTQGMQLPRKSQQTPLNWGTGQSVGVQGPTACVQPAGQGVMSWQLPVAGSQQTFGGQGLGTHEPTRNDPWQAVTVVCVQLPAASQHAPGQGLGLQMEPTPRNVPTHAVALETSVQLPAESQHAPPVGTHGLVGVQTLPAPRNVPWQTAAPETMVQLPKASQHAPLLLGIHGLGVQLVAGDWVPPWWLQRVASVR